MKIVFVSWLCLTPPFKSQVYSLAKSTFWRKSYEQLENTYIFDHVFSPEYERNMY